MSNLPPADMGCHLTGFKESCRALVTREKNCCKRWIQIQGNNPNTGQEVNGWDCVDNWMPMLMIENSQQQRQTGAAVETLRNTVFVRNGQVLAALERATQMPALPSAEDPPRLING